MKCAYCQNDINPRIPNWGYMFEEDRVLYIHMVCLDYEVQMERLETEEYLLQSISF